MGVEFDELIPGNFNPNDYETIIIGGGHLIRPSPDFYYDKFKVPGNHFLNAVGILDSPDDLNYLNDYKYISVRTSWDKERLSHMRKEVHVVPCTTMLLEDLDNIPIDPKHHSLGIHLIPHIFSEEEETQFVDWVSSLPFTVYFLPITHYNQDYIYLRNLSSKIGNSVLLPLMNPLEIFTFIGKLDYFISGSLHGGIFAYRHNIPFILFNYNEKMLYFMKDRGLERYTFTNFEEMKTSFKALLTDVPDYSEMISRDLNLLQNHIDNLKSICSSVDFHEQKMDADGSLANYQIHNLQSQIRGYEIHLERADEKIEEMQHILADRDEKIEEMRNSVVWQLMMVYHNGFVERIMPQGTGRRKKYDIGLKGIRILINEGYRSLYWNCRQYVYRNQRKQNDYERWILMNEPDKIELEEQKTLSKIFKYRPLISIIMPVYNPPASILEEAIKSVLEQTYDNWELCLVDGNSGDDIKSIIKKLAQKNSRIKVKYLEFNLGISDNSNIALKLANGEFIALLDHDDLLAPFALFEVVKSLNEIPDSDFIYSDKDLVTEDGKIRFNPLFKPDWSPEIMLSANYLSHLCIIRKSLIDKVGDFLPDTDGAQDWDLFLRIAEKKPRIIHISKILYHWRESNTSCAQRGAEAKPYIFEAQRIAVQNHLQRRGLLGNVVLNPSGKLRVKWTITYNTKISIIIPSRDINLLNTCVESVLDISTYKNFEIIIIDTGIEADENPWYYQKISGDPRIKIIKYGATFNYSAVNNMGVRHSVGDVLLFLNDDTEVMTSDWLEEMMGWIEQQDIGVVGAKLLRPDGAIQHAGVVIGLTGFAGHPFAGGYENYMGPFGSTEWYRNYLAVTGACMMIRRDVFDEASGFNETFVLCGSDVELCLRIRKKGYRIVYTPFAKLKHHEAASRGNCVPSQDFRVSYEHYKPFLEKGDPYYNLNLSLRYTIPHIKRGPERDMLEFVQEVLNNESEN